MHASNRRVLIEMAVVVVAACALLYALLTKPAMTATRMWPLTILVMMVVVGLVIAGHAAWHARPVGNESSKRPSDTQFDLPVRRYALMAVFAVYVVAVPYAGFLVATTLFMAGASFLLSAQRRTSVAVWAAGGAIAIHLLFVKLFDVPLPRGFTAALGY